MEIADWPEWLARTPGVVNGETVMSEQIQRCELVGNGVESGCGLATGGRSWVYAVAADAITGDGDIAILAERLLVDDACMSSIDMANEMLDGSPDADYVGILAVRPDGRWAWMVELDSERDPRYVVDNGKAWLRGILTARAATLIGYKLSRAGEDV